MKTARVSFCVVPLLSLACGCFDTGSDGILNQAMAGNLPDEDGDGLYDIAPPEGVPFDLEETIGTIVRSNITFAQAVALTGADVPNYVASWLTAEVTVLVTYDDGSTQTITGTFAIEPFELRTEIACPIRVEASANVIADIPFAGRQTFAAFGPIVVDEAQFGGDFVCGITVELEVSLNEKTGLIETSVILN